jgi:hypothetical protein
MSIITGQVIADKVQKLLHDETGIRWTPAELVMWINSAQKEILIYKPNSLTQTVSLSLISGTFQNIAAVYPKCIQLLDVTRATSAGGGAVTNINREILDSSIPSWHTASATLNPLHYVHNPLDPKNFYVYPPNNGAGALEILIAIEPTDLVALASNLSFDAIYESVIIDYVLYRAWGKDSEHTANLNRSAAHYTAFMTALKGKYTAESALSAEAKFANPQPQRQTQQQ